MNDESSIPDGEPRTPAEEQPALRSAKPPDYDQIARRLAAWSFWLGIVSMFIFQLVLVPLAALILGVSAVTRNDPGRLTGKWRAWVGVASWGRLHPVGPREAPWVIPGGVPKWRAVACRVRGVDIS